MNKNQVKEIEKIRQKTGKPYSQIFDQLGLEDMYLQKYNYYKDKYNLKDFKAEVENSSNDDSQISGSKREQGILEKAINKIKNETKTNKKTDQAGKDKAKNNESDSKDLKDPKSKSWLKKIKNKVTENQSYLYIFMIIIFSVVILTSITKHWNTEKNISSDDQKKNQDIDQNNKMEVEDFR